MRRIALSLGFSATLLSAGSALGNTLPVCARTPAVKEFIVNQINLEQSTTKTCADITQQDLESLVRVTVAGKNISRFKTGDFSGLYNLEILNIRSNPYKTLPVGLFCDLAKLKTIVIIATGLESYPDDFLADTPLLENLHSFRNKATTMPYAVVERLGALENIQNIDLDAILETEIQDQLRGFFPEAGPVFLSFF